MGNNSLQTTEKNLRSIAKRYENVKYSVGLAVLFLMKGTSAFSDVNMIQETEKQKDILTDVKKDKIEVKETKKAAKTAQKLKASWANMQFGANDLYSNFFVAAKTKVEKTSIVKSEKTVLVASADNSTSLPMFAKLSSDIGKKETPTMEEIQASKGNLRNSVGNLQDKINVARKENNKEINGLKLELVQLMEQGDQVVKSPWSSWQFGANYFSDNWGSAYKGRGDKPSYGGIFNRSDDIFQRYIHTISTHYSSLITGNDSTQASSNLNGGNPLHFGTTDLRLVEEPIVEVEVSADVKPRQPKKMEPLTVSVNHSLSFTVPELPSFEAPDEKVLAGKTVSNNSTPTPGLALSRIYSKVTTPRVTTVPVAGDNIVAPIQNTDISNGTINITTDTKANAAGNAIDAINSTMEYKTQGVNLVGKNNGTVTFTNLNQNLVSNKFTDDKYSSIINYTMGHDDFKIENTKITVDGKGLPAFRSAISISGDNISSPAPTGPSTLTIGENTKLLQKTYGQLINFSVLDGKYGNLVNKGTIEVTSKITGIAMAFNFQGTSHNPNLTIKNEGAIIGGGHLPTTEEDYLKIKRDEFEGGRTDYGLISDYHTGFNKSGYHFIQNGTFELRGHRQKGFFINRNGGARIFEFNNPVKLLGKKGYGILFFNIKNNLYTEGTIVNKNGYEIIATRGDSDYNPNNVTKSLFHVYMEGESNVGLSLEHTNYQAGSYTNFNVDNIDIVSNKGKNNRILNLQRIDAFQLGGEENGKPHRLLMKDGIGWNNNIVWAFDSTNIKVNRKMEIGSFNTEGVRGIVIQNLRRNDASLTNYGKLVMTGDKYTKAIKDMKPEDLTKAGKGMVGFLANNKGTLTNHGDFLFYGGVHKGNAEYYGDDPNDSTKVKLFSTPFEKNSYGMNAKYGGKIISDGVAYIRVRDKKSIGLFSSQTKDNINPEITISNAKVIAEDGAINAAANKSGIINFKDNNVLFTKKNALTFLTGYENGIADGKFNIQGDLRAEIEKGGTAFYYKLPNSGHFDFVTWYNTNFSHSAGKKLTLNMREGGRVLLLANGKVNLTSLPSMDFSSGALSSLAGKLEITGSQNYIPYSLIESNLKVDRDVNLDSATDSYNKMEITQSSIVNEKTIAGTKREQVAIAQENASTKEADKISLTNKGIIQLIGNKSTGIYGKRGLLLNDSTGKISVGKESAAMYLLEDNEATTIGGKVSNLGDISLGKGSIGIYYSDKDKNGNIFTGSNPNTVGGAYNLKNILSSSENAIGMNNTATPNNKKYINESTGHIQLLGEHSIGMFAEGNGNYLTENKGRIVLGNASSLTNANIGIISKNEKTLIKNSGSITGGKNTVGLYGYQITTTNNSKIVVGDSGIGVYSSKGNLDLAGDLKIGAKEAKGVYLVGNTAQNVAYKFSSVTLGDDSFGLVNIGKNKTITSTVSQATLNNRSMFMYSEDNLGSITNHTTLRSNGDQNYGIYSSGAVTNYGNIDFRNGKGNVGLYSTNKDRIVKNAGNIYVGASQPRENYSIGMAGGYYNTNTKTLVYTGNIENTGNIEVYGERGIGMYATGYGSKAVNRGHIKLIGARSIGMYLDQHATGENYGTIEATTDAIGAIGAVAMNGAIFKNYGQIKLLPAAGSIGTYSGKGSITEDNASSAGQTGTVEAGTKHYSRTASNETEKTIVDETGKPSVKIDTKKTPTEVEMNGKVVAPTKVDTNKAVPNPDYLSVSPGEKNIEDKFTLNRKNNGKIGSIGMYVDTSGVNYTNPIQNLNLLSPETKVDLIFGVEATEYTNAKVIQIGEKILKPYNDAMSQATGKKWQIYSASLTWMATAKMNGDVMGNAIMAKIPYTNFAKKSDSYNYPFTDGLEQRYGVEALGSRENQVFQKLNGIGKNESVLLAQAFDEMKGKQYANVQQRVQATGNILDKEFNYLKKEWMTVSKNSNKIKTFNVKGEYKTNTAGVVDYKNTAYGVAYVHEDETVRLGESTGWYTGIVHNTLKFKDFGNSKEEQLQAKFGIFKSVPFDENNSLNWTISGDIFAGYNKMHRKYLVVNEIFNAKSKYYTYGVGVKNEIGKEFRVSEDFSIRPYGALKVEYGRTSKIKEKTGEIKLEVKSNDYFSVKPEIGTELAYKHHFGANAIKAAVGVAYENELGKVANPKNKARVVETTADWYNLRGEKEDRKGNIKTDFTIGLDNQRVGLTGNIGYDTKGHNVRAGVGLRVIF